MGIQTRGLPHVLHECANAHMIEPRLDLTSATTNDVAGQVPLLIVTSEEETIAQLKKKAMDKQHVMETAPVKTKKKSNPSQKKIRNLQKKEMALRIQQDSEALQEDLTTDDHQLEVDSTELQPLLVDKGEGVNHISTAEKRLTVFEDNLAHLPQDDEYRPILSEDELEKGSEGDDEYSDDDQHCDLLIKTVNGEEYQDQIIVSQGLSPRFTQPSPRLTRSRAATASSNNQQSKKSIIL